MVAGLGVIGLSPSVFWALTMPEWRAISEGYRQRMGGGEAVTPMTPAELDELIKRYPDG